MHGIASILYSHFAVAIHLIFLAFLRKVLNKKAGRNLWGTSFLTLPSHNHQLYVMWFSVLSQRFFIKRTAIFASSTHFLFNQYCYRLANSGEEHRHVGTTCHLPVAVQPGFLARLSEMPRLHTISESNVCFIVTYVQILRKYPFSDFVRTQVNVWTRRTPATHPLG